MGIFDRLLGKDQSGWKPRPFYENRTPAQTMEWFQHAGPWSKLDPRFLQLLTDKFHGNPMFELFVHASQDCGLVSQYSAMGILFDKGVAEFAALSQAALILMNGGINRNTKFAKLYDARKFDDKAMEKSYGDAINAYEAAILLEPRMVPAYLYLARLKGLSDEGRPEAIRFCKLGLEQVEVMKAVPTQK